MRHYEVVFLVHPDQSEQVSAMVERYGVTITDGGGFVHRCEDWGRRRLAYPIDKMHKAHYVMMNIECTAEILAELKENFRYNDAIIRSIAIRRDKAIVENSIMLRSDEREDRDGRRDRYYQDRELTKDDSSGEGGVTLDANDDSEYEQSDTFNKNDADAKEIESEQPVD